MRTTLSTLRVLSLLVLLASAGLTFVVPAATTGFGTLTAWAREEEDEEDREEEGDDEDRWEEDDSTPPTVTETAVPKSKKVTVPKTIQTIVSQPVVETYVETEPGYASDSDGDGLVDALDPDPALNQTAYFTDDDGDSVPNALDSWSGIDDLLASDLAGDTNGNGVLDSYESL